MTVWVSVEEVLALKLLSPPYTAVMEWLPRLSVLMANVAVPADRVPVPSVVAPSLKVTVPVGVTTKPVTVAVNVTGCPNVLGLTDEATAVVLLSNAKAAFDDKLRIVMQTAVSRTPLRTISANMLGNIAARLESRRPLSNRVRH